MNSDPVGAGRKPSLPGTVLTIYLGDTIDFSFYYLKMLPSKYPLEAAMPFCSGIVGAPGWSAAMATSGAGTAAVSPKKILVVEDNELSMKLVSDLLELHGYEILKAMRGDEAVRMAHGSGPDLILLNIQLPDISGLEVARRLKADAATRPIPIVAVTAYAMEGDEEKARTAGVDGYVTKPIRIQGFLRTVETFVAPSG